MPHAKYLYPYGNLPVELACLYACSGITAFGAVKKAVGHYGGKPILVIGAGGVGLMGVRFAKSVLGREPIVADIDENKRKLALENGAVAALDPRDKESRKQIMDLTGGTGVGAAIDFVGAVKKAVGQDGGKPILVIGAGGVGLMGVRFAKSVLGREPIVADIDEGKRKLALENGAVAAVDPRDKEARKQVMDLTGGTGVGAAIDFVGAEASAQFGLRALGRGGRLIIVGLFGGTFSMPLPMFAFTGCQILGSVTGSPTEMKEMMDLVTSGKVTPVPIIKRKLDEADATLQELRKGLIMGRAVLVP